MDSASWILFAWIRACSSKPEIKGETGPEHSGLMGPNGPHLFFRFVVISWLRDGVAMENQQARELPSWGCSEGLFRLSMYNPAEGSQNLSRLGLSVEAMDDH